MLQLTKLLLPLAFLLLRTGLQAQEDSTGVNLLKLDEVSVGVEKKVTGIETKLAAATDRYLLRLQEQERKIRRKMLANDSVLTGQLFDGVEQQYEALRKSPEQLSRYSQVYSGHLDSLSTALRFLKSNHASTLVLEKSLTRLSSIQQKLDQSEKIKLFLAERKRLLKEHLERLGMRKELKGFAKQAYYYSQQLRDVKALWENPSKMEERLLAVLSQNERFKSFFANNSQLAALFSLPGGNTTAASLTGLQTRASIQQALADRFGSGTQVQQLVSQNLQAAQDQLSELKNKIAQAGTGSYGNSTSDIDIPEGFKPNTKRTKTFLQRLEYGINIQSQKARTYFPTTSDLGLSIGYKLNDNSNIGVGASYKLGWGRGWDGVKLSSEGVGLRSYIDYKLKGTLYLSGGYEQNYRNTFRSLQQLNELSAWQQSGLLGLSKQYQVSKKIKGDIKLLWDFLSYQQVPRTQSILFRIGYRLN